jgi:hypothetical protein
LPDLIKEFYHKHYSISPSADTLAHLKQELVHASLRLVLGGAFADAKKNGQITRCADNIWRHWFLEVVLHSADYMEKWVYGHLSPICCTDDDSEHCWSV